MVLDQSTSKNVAGCDEDIEGDGCGSDDGREKGISRRVVLLKCSPSVVKNGSRLASQDTPIWVAQKQSNL